MEHTLIEHFENTTAPTQIPAAGSGSEISEFFTLQIQLNVVRFGNVRLVLQ
jgi:hypothetical protein